MIATRKSLKELVDVTGFEPATPCLQIKVSLFQLFGISNLHSCYLVELQLFGLFQSVLRTFSVLLPFDQHCERCDLLRRTVTFGFDSVNARFHPLLVEKDMSLCKSVFDKG